jgi:hypothetical protein
VLAASPNDLLLPGQAAFAIGARPLAGPDQRRDRQPQPLQTRIGRVSAGMPERASARAASAHLTRKGRGGLGLEIIAKLATVLEIEPAELLKALSRAKT